MGEILAELRVSDLIMLADAYETYGAEVEPLGPDDLCADRLGDLPRQRLVQEKPRHRDRTHTAHGLVQDQTDSLNGNVPLLPIGRVLAKGPQDPGGNEPSSADSDEQCGC